MATLNPFTGKLWPDTPEGWPLDLQASVIDRVLTVPGSQSWRPTYGTQLAYGLSATTLLEGRTGINRMLLTGPYRDPRIRQVRFIQAGARLNVRVIGTRGEVVDI